MPQYIRVRHAACHFSVVSNILCNSSHCFSSTIIIPFSNHNKPTLLIMQQLLPPPLDPCKLQPRKLTICSGGGGKERRATSHPEQHFCGWSCHPPNESWSGLSGGVYFTRLLATQTTQPCLYRLRRTKITGVPDAIRTKHLDGYRYANSLGLVCVRHVGISGKGSVILIF